MSAEPSARPARILLIEPQFVMRRTICAVASQLRLADMHEAPSFAAAEVTLRQTEFTAVIAALDDLDAGQSFLGRLRAGELGCASDLGIVVMMSQCDAARIQALTGLGLRRIIIKPFKVRTILDTIKALATVEQPVILA